MSTKQITEESKQQKQATQAPAKVKAGPVVNVKAAETTNADEIKLKVAPNIRTNITNIRSSTFNATQSTKNEENNKKRKRSIFESTDAATDEVAENN